MVVGRGEGRRSEVVDVDKGWAYAAFDEGWRSEDVDTDKNSDGSCDGDST